MDTLIEEDVILSISRVAKAKTINICDSSSARNGVSINLGITSALFFIWSHYFFHLSLYFSPYIFLESGMFHYFFNFFVSTRAKTQSLNSSSCDKQQQLG